MNQVPLEDDNQREEEANNGQRPPATLSFLIQTLFTQALMALGRVPNPITQKTLTNLDTAKHFIDTLDMIKEKTSGNLTEEESKLLEEVQHQLRMMWMEAKK
ncbi:MAG: DUF1844 domain-containing protein [Pirellulales bacterium]